MSELKSNLFKLFYVIFLYWKHVVNREVTGSTEYVVVYIDSLHRGEGNVWWTHTVFPGKEQIENISISRIHRIFHEKEIP